MNYQVLSQSFSWFYPPVAAIFRRPKLSLLLGIASALLTAIPATAAEKLYFSYSLFQESLQVKSLEAFAKDGTINSDLAFYFWLARADREQQQRFREALTRQSTVDPVQLSRFFYSDLGEDILTNFGRFIQLPSSGNGKHGLRAALILAAEEPGGLSLLSFLRNFPTDIHIDAQDVLRLSAALRHIVDLTARFTNEVKQLSAEEASREPVVDFSKLPDLRQPGPYGFQSARWELFDRSRNRRFYVMVYRPATWPSGKVPVIIFSHGLASRPEDFATRAEHLASYGFLVALPQHPGSDFGQAQALLNGFSRDVFLVSEFIDRPKDISFVLDELQRRNPSEFKGQLDVESVGVAGHSFGGYAAMAVAGVPIDFTNLEADCKQEWSFLNTSMLLQCRALDLPRQTYRFTDPRVKAIAVGNPVNKSIFGVSGLQQLKLPIMLGAGSYDPATPFIFEQVPSFITIGSPERYLALAEGQAHVDFSQIDAGITNVIDSVPGLTLPSPDLLDSYVNAMFTAFFQVYLRGDASYRPFLQASYAAYLSRDQEFKLALITAQSSEALRRKLEQMRP
ncbi:MAG: alpha/beta hydrolase [Leptolyngbyaceae cyanobacterium]